MSEYDEITKQTKAAMRKDMAEAMRKAKTMPLNDLSPEDIRRAAWRGDVKAQAHLENAAERGQAEDQYRYGQMFFFLGKHANCEEHSKAAEWYRKAAEQGYAPAQSELGQSYFLGAGVPKDMKEAKKWATKAYEQGYKEAGTVLYLIENEEPEIIKETPASVAKSCKLPPASTKNTGCLTLAIVSVLIYLIVKNGA